MKIKRIQVKQNIRRSNRVDPYFGSRYSFSPYRACSHACTYCDGRAEKYYVEGEFGSDIVVRTNMIENIKRELPKLREKGFILAGSGVTDAYQPIEKQEKLMLKAAEILLMEKHPVMIISKSVLPERDLALWIKKNEGSGFLLLQTLATLSDEERSIFEPGASKIEERLNMVDKFREAGIPTGITAMPLLPYIWDSQKQLESLYQNLKSRTDFILPGSLTLRPGIQKETYMEVLRKFDSSLVPQYDKLYAENRISGVPLKSYQKNLYKRIFQLHLDTEIPFQMPHRIYRNKISLADEIHILLNHLSELYTPRGINTQRVKNGEAKYVQWLLPRRKDFNRRRSLPQDWLDQELITMCRDNKMSALLDNKKLGSFIESVVLESVEFDYISLKLVESIPRPETDMLL